MAFSKLGAWGGEVAALLLGGTGVKVLLVVFTFVCGMLAASAEVTKQVELYRWVDFPIEAPGAASGIGKWDLEGSCTWTHESGDVKRTSLLWYCGEGDTYVYRSAVPCRGAGQGRPARQWRRWMGWN